VGIRCADHVTPIYPQKLALTTPTGVGRSVGIVRSRTKATEFSLVILHLPAYEDGTVCSETSAYKIQTPGNYPEEIIRHSEQVKV